MAVPMESTDVVAEDQLVVLWPECPCLFDVRSPDFRDRDQREQAVKEIAEKIQRTDDWVKTRLRQLRSTFTRNSEQATSGSARKNVTKRTAWLMEKLQFLAPYVATRTTKSNLPSRSPSPSGQSAVTDDSIVDDDDTEAFVEAEEDDDVPVNSTAPKSTKMPTRKRPKKGNDDEELKLMKSLVSSISRSKERATDEWALFGQFVAESLRKLDSKVQCTAQHLINKVIFDAKMGSFHSNPQPLQQTQYPFPQHPQMFSSPHQLSFPSGQQSQMLPPTIQSPMLPQPLPCQIFQQPLPQQHSNMPLLNTHDNHQLFSQGEVSPNCQEQPHLFVRELNFAPKTTINQRNEEENTRSLTQL